MTRPFAKRALGGFAAFLIFMVALGVFTVARNAGLLSIVGINSQSNDSQVIQAIERTQEVSLLGLGIQGIKNKDESFKIFGKSMPFTGKTMFVQYNFKAKLGVNGAEVKVTKTDENTFLVSVPEFIFIGFDQPKFKIAVEDGDVLSWATPDIDQMEVVNEILNDDARQSYIGDNKDLLQDQTKTFYSSLITSIDEDAVTTFEFAS